MNTNVHEQRNHRHPQVHIREPSRRPTCRRSYRQRKEADFVNPRPQNISIIIVSQSPWSISTTRTTTAMAKWGRMASSFQPGFQGPPARSATRGDPRERRSVKIRLPLAAPSLYFRRHYANHSLEEEQRKITLLKKARPRYAYAPPLSPRAHGERER